MSRSSSIVYGGNLPEDFKAMLKRWGVPLERTRAFAIRCNGVGEPLLITITCEIEEPIEETLLRGEITIEQRTFKLLGISP